MQGMNTGPKQVSERKRIQTYTLKANNLKQKIVWNRCRRAGDNHEAINLKIKIQNRLTQRLLRRKQRAT